MGQITRTSRLGRFPSFMTFVSLSLSCMDPYIPNLDAWFNGIRTAWHVNGIERSCREQQEVASPGFYGFGSTSKALPKVW